MRSAGHARGGSTGSSHIVLDTNVLVSGLLSPLGAPARILDLVINGNVILVLDARIFSEYTDVLGREKFSFPKDMVTEILAFIERDGIFTSQVPFNLYSSDPVIFRLLKCRVSAGVPIVTGNLKHFRNSGLWL